MREHDAVRVHVLRSALAVVGVLGGGAGAYACGDLRCIYARRVRYLGA